jgi:hypothetical protein
MPPNIATIRAGTRRGLAALSRGRLGVTTWMSRWPRAHFRPQSPRPGPHRGASAWGLKVYLQFDSPGASLGVILQTTWRDLSLN